MVNIYTLDSYRRKQNRILHNLRRRKTISEYDEARHLAALVRRNAPFARINGGKLRSQIRRNKNVVTARASNKGFPYIHWINQTYGTGMSTLRVKTPSGKVNMDGAWIPVRGRLMRYGQLPNNWRWTGKAKFFTLAVLDTQKRYGQRMRKNVLHKSIRAAA
jgi:hypothetical protein